MDAAAVDVCVQSQMTEITVDTGAQMLVCPKSWGDASGFMKGSEENKVNVSNASGGIMPHHGSREAMFKTKVTMGGKHPESKLMNMGSEVCEVKKPSAAVWKIWEQGNSA